MKNSYILLILLLVLAVIISCTKYHELGSTDPMGEMYIFGKLTLTDQTTQNVTAKPLAGKTVAVAFSDNFDGLNFLFSTTTDSEGYFKFTNLRKDRKYVVFYNEIAANGTIFHAEVKPVQAPADKLELPASVQLTDLTGYTVTVTDQGGNPIKGASVCAALNPQFIKAGLCDGSNYSGSTDELGHTFAFNVSPAKYYFLAKITVNNVNYTAIDSAEIKTNTVSPLSLKVGAPANPVNNKLTVQLLDQNGVGLAGSRFCLFSSRIIFARDTCEGSSYTTSTDLTGTGSITNITAGKYYILGQMALTNYKLLGRDSVDIPATGTKNLVIRLK